MARPCKAGQKPGDIVMPGMPNINMDDDEKSARRAISTASAIIRTTRDSSKGFHWHFLFALPTPAKLSGVIGKSGCRKPTGLHCVSDRRGDC